MPRKRKVGFDPRNFEFPSREGACFFVGMDENGQFFDVKIFTDDEAHSIDCFFEVLANESSGWQGLKKWHSKKEDLFLEAVHTGGPFIRISYKMIKDVGPKNRKEIKGIFKFKTKYLSDVRFGFDGILRNHLKAREEYLVQEKLRKQKQSLTV